MFTPQDGYGFGWYVDRKGERLVYSHSGAGPGYAAFLLREPEDGLLVVVLGNLERTLAEWIATTLDSILHNEPWDMPREHKRVQVSAEILQQYVGTYNSCQSLTSPCPCAARHCLAI